MQRRTSSDEGENRAPEAAPSAEPDAFDGRRHESGMAPAHPDREETEVIIDLEPDSEPIDDEAVERWMAEAYGHMATGDLGRARESYLAADHRLAREET